MTLMLHSGAETVDYERLRASPVPEATATHVPIPHHEVIDLAKYALGFYGHEVVEEHYGVTPDGARFFGILSLRSSYGDYTDMQTMVTLWQALQQAGDPRAEKVLEKIMALSGKNLRMVAGMKPQQQALPAQASPRAPAQPVAPITPQFDVAA